MRLDKDVSIQRKSNIVSTLPRSRELLDAEKLTEAQKLECREAVWRRTGATPDLGEQGQIIDPWRLHESKVTMMNWFLEIEVHSYQSTGAAEPGSSQSASKNVMARVRGLMHRNNPGQTSTVLAAWREPLSDLMQTIAERGQALYFKADLGVKVGLLTVELDIYDNNQPHRSMLQLSTTNGLRATEYKPPIRKGMPPESKWQDKVRYCCSCFADGLPVTRECRPYIRITMGATTSSTAVYQEKERHDVVWKEPLIITTTRRHRKATVELYHCTNPFGEKNVEQDNLLGSQTIYDVSFDKDYYIHFFGGAMNPVHQDIALNMVRSAHRPASTYHCSVAMIFGTKRQTRNDILSRITQKKAQKRLVVRLHRGLYLDNFKGRKVNVLVQVAGCRLPDLQEAQRILTMRRAQAKARSTGSAADRDMAEKLKLEPPDPMHYSRNILSFSGEVTDAGVLCFTHSREPGCPPERCDWVELTTIKDFPLEEAPNVSHIYLYVVAVGEESEPPKVFGRLRLTPVPPSDANAAPPLWRRLRWDRSVCSATEATPQGYFSNNLAGYILGSASFIPHTDDHGDASFQDADMKHVLLQEAVTKPWVCTPSWSPSAAMKILGFGAKGDPRDAHCSGTDDKRRKTVYCYVDLLAARDLPAMDQDGLMDPSYTVRVLDRELVLPAGTQKTTSPTWMHRLVLPFEMEVENGPSPDSCLVASRSPMPPIVVLINDYDPKSGILDSDRYELVGSIVVKHEQSVGKGNQMVYKMLGYEAEKAKDWGGAEFTTDPAELDLNVMHTAMWHSLDAPGRAPFDAAAGGVDKSWQVRPRVLLAVGYSLQKPINKRMLGKQLELAPNSTGEAWLIECESKACYQIDVDLLGLRNLPPTMSHPKLAVSSFWEGKNVSFDVASGRDYNFQQEGNTLGNEQTQNFIQKMKPLLALKTAVSEEEDVRGSRIVLFEELCGIRIRAPVYRVPVIPYLQQQALYPGRWKMSEQGTEDVVWFELRFSSSKGLLEGSKMDEASERGDPISDGSMHGNIIEWKVGDERWHGVLDRSGKKIENLARRTLDGDEQSPIRRYTGEWKSVLHGDPFVLLPAVTFELSNAFTGAVLTATVGLNRLLLAAGGSHIESWTELSLKEIERLPRELKEWEYIRGGMLSTSLFDQEVISRSDGDELTDTGAGVTPKVHDRMMRSGHIHPLSNVRHMEEAYIAFVDVLAADSGYLSWDEDFYLGRPLQDQCLFYLENELPTLDSEANISENAKPQYFNAGDFVSRYDGPFDNRFFPTLSLQPLDLEPLKRALSSSTELPVGLAHAANGATLVKDKMSGQKHLETVRKKLKLALTKVEELLNPDISKIQVNPMPLGPSHLFKSVIGKATGCITEDRLRKMPTLEMKEHLQTHGWRAITHLCAPEKMKADLKVIGGENLKANLHTFMRPVGHIITTRDRDRDSRILARMNMGIPLHALHELRKRLSDALEFEMYQQAFEALSQEDQRWEKAGNSTLNFFVIKFKLPGMVIWTAPKENAYWSKPGTPLFAVRLTDHPDVVVPVLVPSFDIRRKQETCWYPVKTLIHRFHSLSDRISRQAEGNNKITHNRRWQKARATRWQNSECPSGIAQAEAFAEKVPEMESDGFDILQPDGYSRPIAVAKHAFVCRLRRRIGGVAFDRCQTRNWYKTSVEEVFPELAKLTHLDPDEELGFKTYIMSRFMNIRRPLTADVVSTSAAFTALQPLLKGHIEVTRVADPDVDDNRTNEVADPSQEAGLQKLPRCTAPKEVDDTGRAVENLWISEQVYVRVFVLSAHKLDLSNLGVAGGFSLKPYLSVQLGMEGEQGSIAEVSDASSGTVDFYQRFNFQATFPGPAMLTLEVKHKGLVNDTVIGTCSIDIEDRMLVSKRRSFREAGNKSFLVRNVAPRRVTKVRKEVENEEEGWIEPSTPEEDEKFGVPLKPHSGVTPPSPLEIVELFRDDEETAGEDRVGNLRLWIDVYPLGAHLPEEPEIFQPAEFEVRITIYDVKNIKIFRDFGERNDVYVKSTFRSTNYADAHTVRNHETDVHKYARHEASFNCNVAFTCHAPAAECTLEFTLMDADKFGDNDVIYYPKTYSLDQFVWLAYRAQREGAPHLGPLTDTVIFDRWPPVEKQGLNLPRGCCSCKRLKRRLGKNKSMFARLKIGVQVLPKTVAESIPFPRGQFQEPRNRFSYINAIENPNATAKMLIGPTRWLKIRGLAAFVIMSVFLLIASAILYYIMEIKHLSLG